MNAKLIQGAIASALAALLGPACNDAAASQPSPLVAGSLVQLDAAPTAKAPVEHTFSPKIKTAPPAVVAGALDNREMQLATRLQTIKPLPRKVLLEAAKNVAGAAPVVDEPRAFTLSPRAPVHAGAFMNFVGGNVWVAVGGDLNRPPAVQVGAAASATSFNKYVEVSFPTRAGYAYMLDCQTTGGRHEVVRNSQGSTRSSIATRDGHLLVPLARSDANGRAVFQIASLTAFALSSCQVLPLQ